jgi:hypothetical protein
LGASCFWPLSDNTAQHNAPRAGALPCPYLPAHTLHAPGTDAPGRGDASASGWLSVTLTCLSTRMRRSCWRDGCFLSSTYRLKNRASAQQTTFTARTEGALRTFKRLPRSACARWRTAVWAAADRCGMRRRAAALRGQLRRNAAGGAGWTQKRGRTEDVKTRSAAPRTPCTAKNFLSAWTFRRWLL